MLGRRAERAHLLGESALPVIPPLLGIFDTVEQSLVGWRLWSEPVFRRLRLCWWDYIHSRFSDSSLLLRLAILSCIDTTLKVYV